MDVHSKTFTMSVITVKSVLDEQVSILESDIAWIKNQMIKYETKRVQVTDPKLKEFFALELRVYLDRWKHCDNLIEMTKKQMDILKAKETRDKEMAALALYNIYAKNQ